MVDYQIINGKFVPIAGTGTPTPPSTRDTYGTVGSGNPEDIKGLAPGTGVVKGITPGSGTIQQPIQNQQKGKVENAPVAPGYTVINGKVVSTSPQFNPNFFFKQNGQSVNIQTFAQQLNKDALAGRISQAEYNQRLLTLNEQAQKSMNLTNQIYSETKPIIEPTPLQKFFQSQPTEKKGYEASKLETTQSQPLLKVSEEKPILDQVLGTSFFKSEKLTNIKTGEQFYESKFVPGVFYGEERKTADFGQKAFIPSGKELIELSPAQYEFVNKTSMKQSAAELGTSITSTPVLIGTTAKSAALFPQIEKNLNAFFKPKIVPGTEKVFLKQGTLVEDLKSSVVGKGTYTFKETTGLNQYLYKLTEFKRFAPAEKQIGLDFGFNVKEAMSIAKPIKIQALGVFPEGNELIAAKKLNLNLGKVPKELVGKPFSLSKLDQTALQELATKRLSTVGEIRGVQKFNYEGFVKVGKDTRIIGGSQLAYGKGLTKVRVSPTSLIVSADQEIPSLTRLSSKIKIFDETGLISGKVSSNIEFRLGSFAGTYKQALEVGKVPVSVKGMLMKGKPADVFDVGKVKILQPTNKSLIYALGKNINPELAYNLSKNFKKVNADFIKKNLQAIVLPKTGFKEISLSSVKTVIAPKVVSTAKSVYGYGVVVKPLLNSDVRAIIAASSKVGLDVETEYLTKTKTFPFLEKQLQKQIEFQGVKQKQIQISNLKQQQKQIQLTPQKQIEFQGVKQKQIQTQKQIQIQNVKQVQQQKLVQRKIQPVKQKQVILPKTYLDIPFKPFQPNIPPIPHVVFPSGKDLLSYKKKKGFRLTNAFSVVSRIRGKKVSLALGVPKNLAVAIGRKFTGETTARSFTIKPIGFTSQQDVGRINLFQYRRPKFGGQVFREGFTFVEKSKFAIDTIGEKTMLKEAKRLKKFRLG
jgi:hypothetical protein